MIKFEEVVNDYNDAKHLFLFLSFILFLFFNLILFLCLGFLF